MLSLRTAIGRKSEMSFIFKKINMTWYRKLWHKDITLRLYTLSFLSVSSSCIILLTTLWHCIESFIFSVGPNAWGIQTLVQWRTCWEEICRSDIVSFLSLFCTFGKTFGNMWDFDLVAKLECWNLKYKTRSVLFISGCYKKTQENKHLIQRKFCGLYTFASFHAFTVEVSKNWE